MNKMWIPIASLFLCSYSNSQVDTARSNYFPHHLGDTWVYYVRNGVGDDTLKATIISDSADKGGNTYLHYALATYKSNDPPADYWYENCKIDSLGNVYTGISATYSRFQFKATAQLGDGWLTGYDTAFVYKVFTSSMFGVPTTVRQIAHKVGTEGYSEGYGDGFGIVFRFGSYAIAGELFLVAAKINGKLYGDTTLTSTAKLPFQRIASMFQLYPNYPNPFNGRTIIKYILAQRGKVSLTISDVLGRRTKILVDAHQDEGEQNAAFDSAELPSGVYFYTLQTQGTYRTGKMILQK